MSTCPTWSCHAQNYRHNNANLKSFRACDGREVIIDAILFCCLEVYRYLPKRYPCLSWRKFPSVLQGASSKLDNTCVYIFRPQIGTSRSTSAGYLRIFCPPSAKHISKIAAKSLPAVLILSLPREVWTSQHHFRFSTSEVSAY